MYGTIPSHSAVDLWNNWNNLPEHIVKAPDTLAIEKPLDKHWKQKI